MRATGNHGHAGAAASTGGSGGIRRVVPIVIVIIVTAAIVRLMSVGFSGDAEGFERPAFVDHEQIAENAQDRPVNHVERYGGSVSSAEHPRPGRLWAWLRRQSDGDAGAVESASAAIDAAARAASTHESAAAAAMRRVAVAMEASSSSSSSSSTSSSGCRCFFTVADEAVFERLSPGPRVQPQNIPAAFVYTPHPDAHAAASPPPSPSGTTSSSIVDASSAGIRYERYSADVLLRRCGLTRRTVRRLGYRERSSAMRICLARGVSSASAVTGAKGPCAFVALDAVWSMNTTAPNPAAADQLFQSSFVSAVVWRPKIPAIGISSAPAFCLASATLVAAAERLVAQVARHATETNVGSPDAGKPLWADPDVAGTALQRLLLDDTRSAAEGYEVSILPVPRLPDAAAVETIGQDMIGIDMPAAQLQVLRSTELPVDELRRILQHGPGPVAAATHNEQVGVGALVRRLHWWRLSLFFAVGSAVVAATARLLVFSKSDHGNGGADKPELLSKK